MVLGLERARSRPMRPMIGLSGRPLPVSFVQALPPSVVFQLALRALRPMRSAGADTPRRGGCSGSTGPRRRRLVSLSMNFVFVQVLPR